MDAISTVTATMSSLTADLNSKVHQIEELEKRVNTLEEVADGVEQYSSRNNLNLDGITEKAGGLGHRPFTNTV